MPWWVDMVSIVAWREPFTLAQINCPSTTAAEVRQYQCLLAEVPSCPLPVCCTGHFPCNEDRLCAEALSIVSADMRRGIVVCHILWSCHFIIHFWVPLLARCISKETKWSLSVLGSLLIYWIPCISSCSLFCLISEITQYSNLETCLWNRREYTFYLVFSIEVADGKI